MQRGTSRRIPPEKERILVRRVWDVAEHVAGGYITLRKYSAYLPLQTAGGRLADSALRPFRCRRRITQKRYSSRTPSSGGRIKNKKCHPAKVGAQFGPANDDPSRSRIDLAVTGRAGAAT
jgi:hypothetical protein